VAVATTVDVVSDGDGLGRSLGTALGNALRETFGRGNTPEWDAADRWCPLPAATPTTVTTTTTATADPTATSQVRDEPCRLGPSITVIPPSAEPGLQTPSTLSRFRARFMLS
jgi:hypothetical protein